MENRSELLNRLMARTTTIDDFNFDNLWAPPLLSFLTVEDINYFHKLATSIKYSSKIDFKYSEIDRIMKMRGFVKLGAGTNRVCYRYLEDNSICIKIAIDAVGCGDNPKEFKNQMYFKPFVTKIFEVSPCGTVALVERVEAIKSREEFASIAGDVYDLISKWFIGKYVLDDIGASKAFMNFGLRAGMGPVLLDFPYAYELDGNKLYCNKPDPYSNTGTCDGEIDYDAGFNFLRCEKCGAKYKASELKKAIEDKTIIERRKVESKMKISVRRGTKTVKSEDTSKETKKVLTRREKIYNNTPTRGSGLQVTTNRRRVPDIQISEEVIESVEEDVVEEVVEQQHVTYDTDSKFIPKSEESVVEEDSIEEVEEISEEVEPEEDVIEEQTEEVPVVEDDCDITIEAEEDDTEVEEESVEDDNEEEPNFIKIATSMLDVKEEQEDQEDSIEENIESEENEEDDSEDESIYDNGPVGSAPPKSSNKRSRRFDPEFYNR